MHIFLFVFEIIKTNKVRYERALQKAAEKGLYSNCG